MLYALVIVALTACTVFDVEQLARRGAGALEELFTSGSAAKPSVSVLEHASIGDVVWGKCADKDAAPGAECGYAM